MTTQATQKEIRPAFSLKPGQDLLTRINATKGPLTKDEEQLYRECCWLRESVWHECELEDEKQGRQREDQLPFAPLQSAAPIIKAKAPTWVQIDLSQARERQLQINVNGMLECYHYVPDPSHCLDTWKLKDLDCHQFAGEDFPWREKDLILRHTDTHKPAF